VLHRAGIEWLATHAPPQPRFRTLRVGPEAAEALAAETSAVHDPSALLAAFDRALDCAAAQVQQAAQVGHTTPFGDEGGEGCDTRCALLGQRFDLCSARRRQLTRVETPRVHTQAASVADGFTQQWPPPELSLPARSRVDAAPHDWSDAVRFQRARAALDAARALPLHPSQPPTLEALWEMIQQQLARLDDDPACVLLVPVAEQADAGAMMLALTWDQPGSGLPAPTPPPPPLALAAAGACTRRQGGAALQQQHPIGTPWSALTKRKCAQTGWVPEGTPSLLRPIRQCVAEVDENQRAAGSPACRDDGDAPRSPAAAAQVATAVVPAADGKVMAGLAAEVAAERRAESSFDMWLASEAGAAPVGALATGMMPYVTYAAALCAPTPATKRKRDAAEAEAALAVRGRRAAPWASASADAMQGVYSALEAELTITDQLENLHSATVN
jgi:hypothetical protein